MKNFFDCKDEKITERAFSQSLFISVLSILLCLVALCSMTYAWFTGETSSKANTLTSGSFDLTVSVDGVTVTEDDKGVWHATLDKIGRTYQVTLTLTEESSVKGHCIVKVGTDTPKRTGVIMRTQAENGENSDSFVFTITVTESTTVTFEPCWGVAVNSEIDDGGEYLISEDPADESESTDEPNV